MRTNPTLPHDTPFRNVEPTLMAKLVLWSQVDSVRSFEPMRTASCATGLLVIASPAREYRWCGGDIVDEQ